MRGTLFCCYVPVDRATRIVAVIDMVMGALGFLIFSYFLKYIYARKYTYYNEDFQTYKYRLYPYGYNSGDYYDSRHQDALEKPWVQWAVVICSCVQIIMGVFLYYAVATKNLLICRVWLVLTIFTCIFTILFLSRLYLILIVSDFCSEIHSERRQALAAESCRVTTYQPTAFPSTSQENPFPRPLQLQIPPHQPSIGNFNELSFLQQFHQYQSRPRTCGSLPLYAPTAPPSHVPPQEYDPPPPYYVAVSMPPNKL